MNTIIRKIRKQLSMRSAMVVYWLLCLFSRFIPVRRKRYFCISMTGRGYGDNVKSMADYIQRQDPSADVVWAFDKTVKTEGITERTVRLYTPKYMYYLFTSRYIISNCRMFHALMPRKRKGQTYVQTWHGTALKHVEADAPNLSRKYMAEARHDSSMIDIFISGSRFMTNIYKTAFWYDGPVYETGTPRNDILFRPVPGLREKIARQYHVEGKRIALYAPTFREGRGLEVYDLDTLLLQKTLEAKTGETWSILLRLHPNIISKENGRIIRESFPNCIDVTLYPDMKDLLAVTDLLISDYSSSIFDFLYTGKPCVLYVPDQDSYERGFYFNLSELPFPSAFDNSGLADVVQSFDASQYGKKVEAFLEKIGSVEKGDACVQMYNLITEENEKN